MNRAVSLVTFLIIGLAALVSNSDEVVHGSSAQGGRFTRCFQETELSNSLATFKRQPDLDVGRVSQSLLTKARSSPECRSQLVQTLIATMEHATDTATNPENYFLWQNGASLLADLKATEALDLLVANIDLDDKFSIKLSHCPALVALREIGVPAIPKLQLALTNDPVPHRRRFAAFAIADIGGRQAKTALRNAQALETDSCTKEFLRVSLEAFNNKAKQNHISPALYSKWVSAFYCF